MLRLRPNSGWISRRRTLLALLGLAVCVTAAGCGAFSYMAGAMETAEGKEVDATYTEMKDKSVAIVIYPDQASIMEFPRARQEISAFITAQFHDHMPTVKLVNFLDIITWQDDTRDWVAIPIKDIGRHFSVDRVLYIELLEYSTREPGGANLLRGHIHANAEVFDITVPGSVPAWQKEIDTHWPPTVPEDALKQDDTTVRKHVLEDFSEALVGNFYDHKDIPKLLRDREQ